MTLSEHILDVLAESPLPITTPDLIAIVATGLSHPRQRVHAALSRLMAKGLICRQSGVASRTRGASRRPEREYEWNYRVMRWKLVA